MSRYVEKGAKNDQMCTPLLKVSKYNEVNYRCILLPFGLIRHRMTSKEHLPFVCQKTKKANEGLAYIYLFILFTRC